MCVTEKELDRKGGDYLIVQHGYLIGEHNMITQSCIMGQQKWLINMADCEISTRVLNTLLMRLPTWHIENAIGYESYLWQRLRTSLQFRS